ncbi:MAG: DUF4369 domain-containing protein [Bacteroidales bacterium]|nr:DUF4369 domain-containing protein [Bacteroidales bacterium]MBR5029051.1 DUF4369 domain-containing protein [Bacteroidales bacterium]
MNTKLLYLCLAIVALMFSCGKKNTFTIEGTLQNGAGKYIVIEEIAPKEMIPIDSVLLDKDGHFSFTYEMPYQSFYNVKVSTQDFVMLLPDYGETITLTGDYNHFSPTYQVEGSKGSIQLWQLNDYTKYGEQRLDSIARAFDQLVADCKGDTNCIKKQKPALDSVYKDAYAEQQDYVISFIERNAGSLSTLIALYKTFNTRPLIDPNTDDFFYYEKVADSLDVALPENPHTINFRNTVEHMRVQYNKQQRQQPQAIVTMGNTEE